MNDVLTDDHRELDGLLDQLFRVIDSGTTLEIFEKLDIFWARLAMHIRAEHLQLFPVTLKALEAKKPAEFEYGKTAVARLHSDHDVFMRELAAAMKLVREQIRDERVVPENKAVIREKVDAVRELLKLHNMFEEEKVYGWTEELLNQSEIKGLNELIQKELDNLPPRFDGDRSGEFPRNYDEQLPVKPL